MKKYSFDDFPEHKAMLKPWNDEHGIANALRCGTYTAEDVERCKWALRGLYKAADLEPPACEVIAPSPITAGIAAGIAAGVWWMREHEDQHVSLFGAIVDEPAIESVIDWLCAQQPQGIATDAVKKAVTESIVKSGMKPWKQKEQPAAEVRDAVVKFLVACVARCLRMRNGGNHWSGWVAYVTFFRYVAKLPLDYSKWDFYEKAAFFGPRFMHARFWIVSELPDFIHRDRENRPHCQDGPYIRWRDGRELFYWHGVRVPEEWILAKDRVDPALALTWQNVEQRRCLAEILGWEKVLQQLKPKVIDTDADPMIGQLLEVDLPDAPGEKFLRVRCATQRSFVLPVPREMQTALQANSWTYEISPEMMRKYKART